MKDVEVRNFSEHVDYSVIMHDIGHHKVPVILNNNNWCNPFLSRTKIRIASDHFWNVKVRLPYQLEGAFTTIADHIGRRLPVVLKLDPDICRPSRICGQNSGVGNVDIGTQLAPGGIFRKFPLLLPRHPQSAGGPPKREREDGNECGSDGGYCISAIVQENEHAVGFDARTHDQRAQDFGRVFFGGLFGLLILLIGRAYLK